MLETPGKCPGTTYIHCCEGPVVERSSSSSSSSCCCSCRSSSSNGVIQGQFKKKLIAILLYKVKLPAKVWGGTGLLFI